MSNADVWAAGVSRAGVSGGAAGPFWSKGRSSALTRQLLKANAELRGIVARDTGERYQDFLTKLARLIRGPSGPRLLRLRGERVERPFAHLCETGGVRHVHSAETNILIRRCDLP
jgi:hypothetical protein